MVFFSIGVNPKIRSQWDIVDHCPADKLVEHFFTFIEKKWLRYQIHVTSWHGRTKYQCEVSNLTITIKFIS